MSSIRVAYADPPYLGCGRKHYGKLHPEASRWDTLDAHAQLIAELERDYPDGWAMSLGSSQLRSILPLCPEGVRVGAWVKPWAIWKKERVVYAWEPVIWRGGRRGGAHDWRTPDFVIANTPMQTGTPGAKPEAFAFWLFDVLGLQAGDEFVDLFPGSGIMGRCWQAFRGRPVQGPLFAEDVA